MTCKNALVVFDEIPPPRQPELSQQKAVFYFAVFFVFYFATSVILWMRLGHPPSVGDKIAFGDFVLGSLLSGVFLLTAQSATPQDNRSRLFVLRWAIILGLMIAGLVEGALR